MECVENGADLIAAAIKSGEKLIVVDDSPTEMVYLSGCTAPRYQDALIGAITWIANASGSPNA